MTVYNQPCHQCPDDLKFDGPHGHDTECRVCGCALPTPGHWCQHNAKNAHENGVLSITVGLKTCEVCHSRYDEGCWEWCHFQTFRPVRKLPPVAGRPEECSWCHNAYVADRLEAHEAECSQKPEQVKELEEERDGLRGLVEKIETIIGGGGDDSDIVDAIRGVLAEPEEWR